jgi:plastocyanin
MTRALAIIALTAATAMYAVTAFAAEEFKLVIKDHKFHPEVMEVPAGERIKLVVHNEDPTPEEFESHELMREKIINGNSKAVVFIGPLEPGEYNYFGEFNMDTALGKIVAK